MTDTRVKIIGTLGPASSDVEIIRSMVKAGMDVTRLNFSHGDHAEQEEKIDLIKSIRNEWGVNVGIMQDLGGPKIRIGRLSESGVEVETGQLVTLSSNPEKPVSNTNISVPLPYPHLTDDVPTGSRVLIDDGFIELEVKEMESDGLICAVIRGGRIMSRKGVSFPGQALTIRTPTKKDIDDLDFGLANGVDIVALSFVQSADDVFALRKEISRRGSRAMVIAKLETKLALQNLDSILEASDGVMVARGDLGIETDLSMVPVYQKTIVRRAIARGKVVIVATQMLESMVHSPIPTRAESADVANAVYDGVDAVMLSGETAVGKYPEKVIDTARRIALNVENNLGLDHALSTREEKSTTDLREMAVARSVCLAATEVEAICIVAHTLSGQTARLIAQNRPRQPIIAITPNPSTCFQVSLVWGTTGLLVPEFEGSFLDTIRKGDRALIKNGFAKNGDTVIVTAGIPEGQAGGTNVMKVHNVGQ